MNDVKCECGHVNPHGTILCESCGRVLNETEKQSEVVDMRYEGTARRSQTYKKTIIDKIWNFFSSVKVGVWLIVVTLSASALGTVFPQEMYIPPNTPASVFYKDEYGFLGQVYYELGFHNLYGSWWYLLLIASIGISLVICSLDRFIPLHRALKTQRTDRHEGFLKRQRLFSATDLEDGKVDIEALKERLKKSKYKVKEENGAILAEKNRFSRWGPYVNHIGLIVFLVGAMLRFVPGMYMDKSMWLREGETKQIPGTKGQYFLENKKFVMEIYDKNKEKEVFSKAIDRGGMVAKNFQTDAVLYERQGNKIVGEKPKLKQIEEKNIRVNEPLKVGNLAIYQVNYKLDELNQMYLSFNRKSDNQSFGKIKVDLNNPKVSYDLGKGYKVKLINYFPDFVMGDDGKPTTVSKVPNNPAFVFKMFAPDKPKGEVSFVAIKKTIEGSANNEYKMAFAGIETKNVTALTIRKDLTIPFLIIGGIIFMIGVVQGAYWHHRRIWIQKKGDKLFIAAHTNKNWHGLKRDISKAIDGFGWNEPEDRLQKAESSK
ncbi:cytochrome c biogenesis protein ResB [Bacillus testis]|uniref:cytochrome c biogenesis protein ResB n=1 Tax=Bacillus testis TaxID=1622072 RepID=UPI00067F0B86|nr:cytochrome c biogenesis protein ResB [Bacillus testis]